MKFEFVAARLSVVGAAAVAGLLAAAPAALADPAPLPAPPPAPISAEAAPLPGPAPGPAVAAPVAVAAPADPAPEGIPHLFSPDNPPPGTSVTPPTSTSRLGYLRDLWHAMQTQEVSGSDALLLFTQRPMSAAPSPNMPAGPQPAPQPQPVPLPVPPPAPPAP